MPMQWEKYGEIQRENYGKNATLSYFHPWYEADSVHPSVISPGFLMHRKRQVVGSPGDVTAKFHCTSQFERR